MPKAMKITRRKFMLCNLFGFLGFFVGIPSSLAKKVVSVITIFKFHKMTQVGIIECKYALEKSNGNISIALKAMLKRGEERYYEHINRRTPNGKIVAKISDDYQSGTIIKIACETDYAAKTNTFIKLAKELAEIAHKYSITDVDKLTMIRLKSGIVNDKIIFTSFQLKENIKVTDIKHYTIGKESSNTGNIGSIIKKISDV